MFRRRWLVRTLKVTVMVAATYWLALPQLGRAYRAIGYLDDRGLALPIFGGLLAVAAVVAYAQVTRVLFDRSERPGIWLTLGIVTSALGVNRLLPAGAAAGTVVTFKLFGRAGIAKRQTGFVMAAQGLGSNLLLVLLVGFAMLAALPVYGFRAGYVTVAIAGAALVGLVVLLGDAFSNTRSWPRRLARVAGMPLGRIRPGLNPDRLVEVIDSTYEQTRLIRKRREDLRSALVWGLANWILDAASLWVFLTMAGARVTPQAAFLVFGLANVAALLPFTPGGLGVVDLTMTAALAGIGVPDPNAVIGVAAYRLSHYWLPIPAAALAYLLVRRHVERTTPAVAAA